MTYLQAGSATLLRAWSPEDFEPISQETPAIPKANGERSVDNTKLYRIASQVQEFIKQPKPGLANKAGNELSGPNNTGSAPTTPKRPTSVVPAKRPLMIDLTTPEPKASPKRASPGTPSPRHQLRRQQLGPAAAGSDLDEEPESPPS